MIINFQVAEQFEEFLLTNSMDNINPLYKHLYKQIGLAIFSLIGLVISIISIKKRRKYGKAGLILNLLMLLLTFYPLYTYVLNDSPTFRDSTLDINFK